MALVSSRSGQANVWILDFETRALRNVTNDPAGDFRPFWSPDGQSIAFSSDRDSKKPMLTFATLQSTELYVVRPEGSGVRRVTWRNAVAGSPSWSADGKRLVYYETEIGELQRIRRFGGVWPTSWSRSGGATKPNRSSTPHGSGLMSFFGDTRSLSPTMPRSSTPAAGTTVCERSNSPAQMSRIVRLIVPLGRPMRSRPDAPLSSSKAPMGRRLAITCSRVQTSEADRTTASAISRAAWPP
jgi:WD40-like Beta Propeller Repeat